MDTETLIRDVREALAKATPGPWCIDRRTSTRVLAPGDDRGVCTTGGPQNNRDVDSGLGENEANAHLIAHAPEWLAALLTALEQAHWERDEFGSLLIQAASELGITGSYANEPSVNAGLRITARAHAALERRIRERLADAPPQEPQL